MVKNKSYSSSKRYRNNGFRKRALVIIIACVLVGGGYFAFTHFAKNDPTPGSTAVNLDPPTETEKKEVEENKDRLVENKDETTTNPNTPPPGSDSNKKSVKPVITEASRTSVRAYVNGIFEEGGTCTATFTKGGQTLTKTSTGFQNASYTQCAPINFDSSFLSSGKWSVTVKYSSGTAEGTSDMSYIE